MVEVPNRRRQQRRGYILRRCSEERRSFRRDRLQRNLRLRAQVNSAIRSAMEAQDFTVYRDEWWHFDYKDWRRYRIGNEIFEEIGEG